LKQGEKGGSAPRIGKNQAMPGRGGWERGPIENSALVGETGRSVTIESVSRRGKEGEVVFDLGRKKLAGGK